ncbi:molybdate ABC transporter permease [Staphylococcus agnetis]|nr:molybdate ABC transporter permease [Staphylococcus agnetis]
MADLTPLWISLRIACISTIVVVFLSITLAKLLYNKQNIWTRLIESFIFLPIILPPTVLGFLLLIVFQ